MHINKSVLFIKSILTKLALVAFAYQLYLDLSAANVISNVLLLITCLLMFRIVLTDKNKTVSGAFLATIVLVTILSNTIAPLVATSIEQKPLIYKLILPVEVFTIRLIYALLVLLAYVLLVNKRFNQQGFLMRLSNLLKIKTQLTYRQVWIWGFTGFFFFLLRLVIPSEAFAKFLAGFNFLLWSPFILLVPPYFNITKRKNHFKYLFIYFLLMILLASFTNSRMGFVGPLMVVAFGFLVNVFLGKFDLKGFVKHNKNKVILSLGVFFIFFTFLVKLSDAITFSRKFREDIPTSELMYLTYINFVNGSENKTMRRLDISHDYVWSEDYVDNPFLARFISIKFDDNCLVRINRFNETDIFLLKDVNNQKLLAQLPSPILNSLGISIDKIFINSFSTGDYIDHLANGSFLDGKKTGSFPVHVYALFGNWSILIAFLMVYLAFRVYAIFLNTRHYSGIPTFALIMPWFFYLSVNPESYTNFMSFFLRSLLQTMLLFGLMATFSTSKRS